MPDGSTERILHQMRQVSRSPILSPIGPAAVPVFTSHAIELVRLPVKTREEVRARWNERLGKPKSDIAKPNEATVSESANRMTQMKELPAKAPVVKPAITKADLKKSDDLKPEMKNALATIKIDTQKNEKQIRSVVKRSLPPLKADEPHKKLKVSDEMTMATPSPARSVPVCAPRTLAPYYYRATSRPSHSAKPPTSRHSYRRTQQSILTSRALSTVNRQ
jgi:hypothetical protein